MPFCYSNNGLTMRAVDEDYQASEGEVVFEEYPTPEQLSASFPEYDIEAVKEQTKRQIFELEKQVTPRRLREAALTEEGKTWLADIDQQIADLRASL